MVGHEHIVARGIEAANPTVLTFTPVTRTPFHADHIATRYRKRMSPVMKVQGKHITAATGNATAQKASIRMVRITGEFLPQTPDELTWN